MTPRELEPCQYPDHRPTDWRLRDSAHVVCGACHAPAAGLDVIRRGDRGFNAPPKEDRP